MLRLAIYFGLLVTVSLAQYNPNCGGKTVIVHLFEWKWTDIALECERYLATAGYCGVQVSPPTEHVKLGPGQNDPPNPWWQRYQPASYKLFSRSGTESQFIDMVQRCNKVGVRIYVDAVINHMTGLGRNGTADGGSIYDAPSKQDIKFPGVPYTTDDFTPPSMCPSGDGNVNNYADPNNVRNCYLVGLTDLYGAKPEVRAKVAAYLNNLIDIGVAGIRIDAAKHMWPADIGAIYSQLKPLPTSHGFPAGSKFYVYQEVIDQSSNGEIKVDEYYDYGHVTEFRYCQKIGWGIQDFGQLANVVDYGWGMAPSNRAFIFVDNHDNQRGHGGGGSILMYKDGLKYKQAIAYTLALDYGFTQVMSSFDFTNTDAGPQTIDGYTAADVTINPDGSCGNGWICEHRWNVHKKMVLFRNSVQGTDLKNYWNNGRAVAFSRGNKGFFAMAQFNGMDENLQTGLPAGSYCNIIDNCATKLNVGADGMARVTISNAEEPILAVCVGCDGANTSPPTGPTIPTTTGPTLPPLEGVRRTVVFIKKQTNPGQDMFVRGGIDGTRRPPCLAITDSCNLPITTNSLGSTAHYEKYNAWRVGDTKLDWFGVESGQGSYTGSAASGTPLAWTTSAIGDPGYQSLNTWGDHYWMVDFDLDCSKTENGWFEVKSFVTGGVGWENDIIQSACTGTAGGQAPYRSNNHLGRCGYVNVFESGANTCIINALPV